MDNNLTNLFNEVIDDLKSKRKNHNIGLSLKSDYIKILKRSKCEISDINLTDNNFDLYTDIDQNVKIKNQNIKVSIKLKSKTNCYDITYRPKINFLDDTSCDGEIIPNNIISKTLIKCLLDDNINPEDKVKIVNCISYFWD
tara:strand:- start:60 stop:482 length:423 start_codon:yes stop_codon:yes gene_type:complete